MGERELSGWTTPLLVGLPACALFVAWGAADGGYPPTYWYPGALLFLALVGAAVLSTRGSLAAAATPTLAALAGLAAFTAWTFLTLLWADVPGEAWDGANRTLLYLLVFAAFALVPWRGPSAALLLGAYAVGVAAVGAVTVQRALDAADVTPYFNEARFDEPLGYVNGLSALFMLAFWPALVLASRPEVPALARALLLACAGLLVQLAVLPQSRGFLFALPVVLVLFVLVVPGRVRALVAALLVAAATAWASGPLLDLYPAVVAGRAGEGLSEVRDALALSFVALAAAGLVLALVDRRVSVPPSVRTVAGGAAVAGTAAALAAALLVVGSPLERAADAWEEFRAGQQAESGASHLTGNLGSNRYDYWRVGMQEFARAPVRGIGADNFAVPYLLERASSDEPRYPHSLQVQILSQTGIVGGLLFAVFLAPALVAAWGARRAPPLAHAAAAGAVVSFGYWAVHGTVDWFWEIPALGAPAFACLGLAAALGRPDSSEPRRAPGGARGLALGAAATIAALAAAVSLTLPWLAAREVERATEVWREDAPAARAHLDRARRLNPLSDHPDLVAGAVASRLEDWELMRTAFERAVARNPHNWYAHLELAVAAAVEGREDEALARLERARELNPREDVIELVRDLVQRAEPVAPHEIDRLFVERLEEVTR